MARKTKLQRALELRSGILMILVSVLGPFGVWLQGSQDLAELPGAIFASILTGLATYKTWTDNKLQELKGDAAAVPEQEISDGS